MYEALSYHIWEDKGDPDPQSVLNRAADKCIKGEEDPNFDHATCRSFNRSNCEIEEQYFTLNELSLKARRYPHVEREPTDTDLPIILLMDAGRTLVIDGHNRLKKWEREGKAGIRPK